MRMRIRDKNCHLCSDKFKVLFRCRYEPINKWVFLCDSCLVQKKSLDNYQYGGTWKAEKI